MQTQQDGQLPHRSPERERDSLPWGRLALVALVIILLAISAVIFIYLNTGAAILFTIFTILGLIFAFLQIVPSLFPSKKSSPASMPPIIIHTPHIQPGPLSTLSNNADATPGTQNEAGSPIVTEKLQHKETEPISLPRALPSLWYMPLYRPNPLFTGREDILKSLHDSLTTDDAQAMTQPLAITGLGGIGKTQIAIEYAYRYREYYQTILWVSADSRERVISDYVSITALLGLPEYDTSELTIAVNALKHWLEMHTGWLLILDNADDLAMLSQFLPSQGKGAVLLTTRAQATSSIAQSIEVDRMKPEEGALFLLRRAKIVSKNASLETASDSNRSMAKTISDAMDGLPLALDQAGAYIEYTACSLSEYLNLFRQRTTALLKRREGPLIADHLVFDHPEPVPTTWVLSLDKIEQNNPAAAELLRFCAFLHHDAIPEEILGEGASELGPILSVTAADKLELNDAIGELRKFSFIRRNSDANTLSIHRLVQLILKDGMDENTQRLWAERAVRAMQHVMSNVVIGTWQQCHRYLPQIQDCSDLIKQHGFSFPEAIQFLDQAGCVLQEHAYYTQAETLYRQAQAICETGSGAIHSETANILNDLARLYYIQGKYIQAEPLYLRALAIREAVLGPEHPDTATTLNNLARLYHAQGKYAQAEPLYSRSLVIREAVLGPEHPGTATTLNNLARLYYAQGKYAQAEPLFQRALAITEKTPGAKDPDKTDILNNLAILYRTQGKYAQAEELYQRALAIREAVLGPEHPDTATTLNNLARLYRTLEKYAQAEELYRRALAIRETVLGPEHPDTASTLNNLARLYYAQEKYAQAEPLFQRVLQIYEKTKGPEHPDIAGILNNLALLYGTQGKYSQAEELYLRALAIREAVLGPEHPDVASILNNLALLYSAHGKYSQAEPLFQRALSIREALLGLQHPEVAAVLENYAGLLRNTKRATMAAKLETRIQSIRAKHAE